MNKAARVLYISQPALSQSIRDLERDLGFKVFERSSRGAVPTPEGYVFLTTISEFVKNIEELKEDYSRSTDRTAVLRVSSNRYTFVNSALISYYEKYLENEPGYSLILRENNNLNVFKDVTEHRSDIGIIHVEQSQLEQALKKMENKRVGFTHITYSRQFAFFRKGHPLSKLKNVNISDLVKYPQVRLLTGSNDHFDSLAANNIKYGNPGRNILADSRDQIYSIVAKTDAVSYGITNRGVSEFFPTVESRPVNDDDRRFCIYAVYLADHNLNSDMRKFIAILRECFEDPKT